jgi:hypothetical protein
MDFIKQRLLLALLVFAVGPLTTVAAQVGSSFCHGVGCPCGNDDPSRGCGNRGDDFQASTGALLIYNSGVPSALQDSLEFSAYGLAANQFGVLFMGGGTNSFSFGDGLRCVVSGGQGVYRFPVQQADFFGEFQLKNLVSTSQGFPGGGPIQPGESWNFQVWYRDPNGPCSSNFNLTNAIPVDFYAAGGAGDHEELAGRPLGEYPWFEYVRAFNQGDPVSFAVDPGLKAALMGTTSDVYVVLAKDQAEWANDPSLFDVRGVASSHSFNGANVQGNTFTLDPGFLSGTSGAEVGIGYDVVIDLDGDGQYDAGEPIDGLGDEAGFYVVRDVAGPGPYTVVETIYSFGSFRGQDTYYPANIASLGQVPLVVVSHGNGHNYQWYDHIGQHLASYGYVVMSHQNNTMPGIETASTTTLENTDDFLGNLGSIDGGALVGHIDSSRITWIGHSRGGEGVVRAYTRLVGGYSVQNYSAADVKLISSIAPVTFNTPASSNPGDVNYHLFVGSADNDVTGVSAQTHMYSLMERAVGYRSSITLQGAGHGAFHNGSGGLVASGPCLLSRAETHQIMRGQLLPLVRHYIDGDIPSKDFLWRQWESFKPLGAPPLSDPCVVVTFDYRDGPAAGNYVIDDFDSNTSHYQSSSGFSVSFDVANYAEASKRDAAGGFGWSGTQPMNGMTRAISSDNHPGVVFDWDTPAYWEAEIDPLQSDFADYTYLSLRACQGTRHPNTTAALEDLTFLVSLRDVNGVESTISIGAYGGGIEEPYQRSGSLSGGGVGWHNEMETIRIRLTDFLADESGLNLHLIQAVRFDFGGQGVSPIGRQGMDDIELTRD